MLLDFNRLKIGISFLPPDILVGFSVSPGEAYCNDCDDIHELVFIRFGLLFLVVNIMWFK